MVAFCTEFTLFTVICFVLFKIMDLPYVCDHQLGYSAGGYSLSPRWFLTWYIYPFFSGLAALRSADIARNLWSLVCSCLNSYWTFHLFPLLFFFSKMVAFCTEFNLLTLICFVLFMIMDLPYVCDHQVGYSAGGYSLSPGWFLTWCIYPFFSGLAALMSADIARNLWSLVCRCLNSYWTFHLFPLLIFFFKMVAFCTEFNLFTLICFVLFMIMDLPYVCDHQVGYSAGGYSLSPRSFLTWYIYPFFSGLAALMSADIARNLWSLVCSCLNSNWTFHLFPLLIFFSKWLLSALNSICLPSFVLFSLW